ncbi:MAG: hypothetical protein SGI91_01015 [Alphaproteobacteria bacterium]|nr:hypothetical protein [Alphaproteobacteria bacterium]
MLKSLGRSIFTFFARPAPTSVALMAGPRPGLAANDDQSQMLRRAMQAASAAEETREDEAPEGVQNFEPLCVDEFDDSAAAQAAVFAPARPMTAAPANDAVTHDAVEEPAFEATGQAPIEFADWVEVEIDEHAAAEADLALEVLVAPVAGGAADAIEALAFEVPVEVVANDIETLPLEAEPVEEPAVELPSEESAKVANEEVASDEQVHEEPAIALPSEKSDVEAELEEPAAVVAEKKSRKKRAPAKRKAAAKPRKAKVADEAALEPVPEDDVWVSDAVAWSLSGEWADGAQVPPESSDFPRRLEELHEAAAEGRLTIWGRTGDAGTWQPIEASYWKSGTVEPASLAEGRENVVAEPKTKGKAKSARKYSALKVSRAQVEDLWQPDAMH